MQIQVFNIPIGDKGEMQAEMNRFLSAIRVLQIEQHFYQNEIRSVLEFFCSVFSKCIGDLCEPFVKVNRIAEEY